MYWTTDYSLAAVLAERLGSLYSRPKAFSACLTTDEYGEPIYAVCVRHKGASGAKLQRVRQWCDGYATAKADARAERERREEAARAKRKTTGA